MASLRKFIDIGANLTDTMYSGVYHGSKKHDADLQFVLERAWASGLQKIIVTGGSLEESKQALRLARSSEKLYSTVGCHPTRCGEIEQSGDADAHLAAMAALVQEGEGKVVAIGECGLDYDRLEFCPKEIQNRYFEAQLNAFNSLELPLFLHCRNAAGDLVRILERYRDTLSAGGVVHSFDGTKEDATAFLNLGYHIGINGCSLKTESNLSLVSFVPAERLLLETDSPWCDVRPTHAGFKFVTSVCKAVKKEKWQSSCGVKGRNEPMNITQIFEIVAAIRGEDPDTLCQTIYENTKKLFFPSNKNCPSENS